MISQDYFIKKKSIFSQSIKPLYLKLKWLCVEIRFKSCSSPRSFELFELVVAKWVGDEPYSLLRTPCDASASDFEAYVVINVGIWMCICATIDVLQTCFRWEGNTTSHIKNLKNPACREGSERNNPDPVALLFYKQFLHVGSSSLKTSYEMRV